MVDLSSQSHPAGAVDVFVIGTASLDVLHLVDGQTAVAAGGAGLYTALAAHRAGAKVALFAPRPDPMPEPLLPASKRMQWSGPVISIEDLPRLEIEHHGQGRATLKQASWGAEALLQPENLPPSVAEAATVHIAALSTAQRQLDFLESLKELRRARSKSQPAAARSLISVGTYAHQVYHDKARVRELFSAVDLFFMNENEATGLFGSLKQARVQPGKLLCVTLDAEGALVIETGQTRHIPGRPATELDPTGAGDTFCGATLAGLAAGLTPIAAVAEAVKLAAQTVQSIGPAALIG